MILSKISHFRSTKQKKYKQGHNSFKLYSRDNNEIQKKILFGDEFFEALDFTNCI